MLSPRGGGLVWLDLSRVGSDMLGLGSATTSCIYLYIYIYIYPGCFLRPSVVSRWVVIVGFVFMFYLNLNWLLSLCVLGVSPGQPKREWFLFSLVVLSWYNQQHGNTISGLCRSPCWGRMALTGLVLALLGGVPSLLTHPMRVQRSPVRRTAYSGLRFWPKHLFYTPHFLIVGSCGFAYRSVL